MQRGSDDRFICSNGSRIWSHSNGIQGSQAQPVPILKRYCLKYRDHIPNGVRWCTCREVSYLVKCEGFQAGSGTNYNGWFEFCIFVKLSVVGKMCGCRAVRSNSLKSLFNLIRVQFGPFIGERVNRLTLHTKWNSVPEYLHTFLL